MCINMQPVTTIYTIQLAIAIPQPQYSLSHPLFVPLSAPSPRSPLHGPYTGEFRGHTHSYSPHHHTNLRVSKPPSSSNFPRGKNRVWCIHQDGRSYSNLSRIRWHSTFKAEMLHYQYHWMASSIRSLRLSNCQDTTSPHFRPHGIPDSDSVNQQRILQWLLVGIWSTFPAASCFSVPLYFFPVHIQSWCYRYSSQSS